MAEKKVSDKKAPEISDIDILSNTVAQLVATVQTQNDVILCLLHKFDADKDVPAWITRAGMEEEMRPKVQACVKKVRELYGHSETDKS